ncbi:MAG: hypothetical protein Q8S21_03920 [Candidatus Paracaedibacteraceae bacterium]|nr:hypothetical protein [Candidatus Paracaedibacteraceae bacterium]
MQKEETKNLYDHVIWANSSDEFYEIISGLVIAYPPQLQVHVLDTLCKSSTLKWPDRLILEKPIASAPHYADSLLGLLLNKKIHHRISYLFLYLPWFNWLKNEISEKINSTIDIEWNFLAYHFHKKVETWKKYHSQGGGVLRFYSIHFLPILVDLGFYSVCQSTLFFYEDNIPIKWDAQFEDEAGNKIKLRINIYSKKTKFKINITSPNFSNKIFEDVSVFSENKSSAYIDIRSEYIESVFDSFENENKVYYAFYNKINSLWNKIEGITIEKKMPAS